MDCLLWPLALRTSSMTQDGNICFSAPWRHSEVGGSRPWDALIPRVRYGWNQYWRWHQASVMHQWLCNELQRSVNHVRLYIINCVTWASPFDQLGIKTLCTWRLLSLRGVNLPRITFTTLRRWQCISTLQHQDATRVTQTNLIANYFARKSISRQWLIFSPANL